MTAWTHFDLQRDLRLHLLQRRPRPMVAAEIALDGRWGSSGRLDVVASHIGSGYRTVTFDGYEVKAHRSDWLKDQAAEKWTRYLEQLDRLWFAVPDGGRVMDADEVPATAGLIVRGERGWEVRKKAPRLAGPGDVKGALMRLCRRLADENAEPAPESRLDRMRRLAAIVEDQELAYVLSKRFRDAFHVLRQQEAGAERRLEELQAEHRRLEAEIARLRQLPDVLEDLDVLMRAARAAVAPLAQYDPERSAERRDHAREVLHDLAERLRPATRLL